MEKLEREREHVKKLQNRLESIAQAMKLADGLVEDSHEQSRPSSLTLKKEIFTQKFWRNSPAGRSIASRLTKERWIASHLRATK